VFAIPGTLCEAQRRSIEAGGIKNRAPVSYIVDLPLILGIGY
jgi:hypothetical protein